ncbi:MAG: prolyl oligopeptidase family serine peptidase [Luteolibacter sp.]
MKSLKLLTLAASVLWIGTEAIHAQTPPPVVNPLAPDYVSVPLKDWEKPFADFQFKLLEKDGRVLPYRFHQPVDLKPGTTYPLVLFFHGAGERGSDNRGQFQRLRGVRFWESHPCFIIAPQCPAKNQDGDQKWVNTGFGAPSHTMEKDPTWQMKMAMDLLKKTIESHPVDRSRIYVTGLSMGGFATWDILQRDCQKFAAAIPVCGGGDVALAGKLAHLPLWIFHGSDDTTVLPQRSRDMVAAIKAAGGSPKYTEYPGVGHGAWDPAYSTPELWDWLFSQVNPSASASK